jgi:hypothetical protein
MFQIILALLEGKIYKTKSFNNTRKVLIALLRNTQYTVKKVRDFPILNRDVTSQTLPARESLVIGFRL